MEEFLEVLLVLSLLSFLFTLKVGDRILRIRQIIRNSIEARQKRETKESLDQVSYQHTPHWEYLLTVTTWQTRLRLSRCRGKKRALTRQIKNLLASTGMAPQVGQWLLEEYMITAKAEQVTPPEDAWVCAHCGAANAEPSLFCKDCGEYK